MIDEILESYEMRAKAAEEKAQNSEAALNRAIYVIIENANHTCKGCPLKGSGLPRNQNSCRNRLIEYFTNRD